MIVKNRIAMIELDKPGSAPKAGDIDVLPFPLQHCDVLSKKEGQGAVMKLGFSSPSVSCDSAIGVFGGGGSCLTLGKIRNPPDY
jgi:hypothetical protein